MPMKYICTVRRSIAEMDASDHRFDTVKLFIYPVTLVFERSTWQRFIKKMKFRMQKTTYPNLAARILCPIKITI